ncbi:MAG TPA: NAD(P)H-dependent glycerol-3-phosphate dehydrogenase [Chloroflexota bacterium]|nr:NAD(P)H-dependent glycerol-3-phosphate dehydrogenase [Chloroflexota bacterium]
MVDQSGLSAAVPANILPIPSLAIIGAGNWGTTLALLQARAGRPVLLCARTPERAARLAADRENRAWLPGVGFPPLLSVAAGYAEAARAELIVIAVPSEHLKAACGDLRLRIRPEHRLVSATKGLEVGSGKRVSTIIGEVLPEAAGDLCVLSGPNLAGEIAAGLPAAAVLAGAGPSLGENAAALATRLFRLYTSDDLIGVELGGALKNVVALAAGICDGLRMGLNSKAAIVTRGMAEIVRLGVACGAQPATFAGLSGYGDLFATCVSPSSRNHSVGEQLGRGRSLEEIRREMTMVAEGVPTARAALVLAARHGVELPITEQVCEVLFGGRDPRSAMDALLSRSAGHEDAGAAR